MKKSFYSKVRKITSAFIAATISMSLMTAAPASAEFGQLDSSAENFETVTDSIFEIQRRACEAHKLLYSSFGWNETYIYPDNFAGDFIDYDTLHIQVTDEAAIDYYKMLLNDYSDTIVYDVVEYSYNNLYNETENYVTSIKDDYGIVSYGVDIMKNKGSIYVLSSDYEEMTLNIQHSRQNISEKIIIEPKDNYVEKTVSLITGSQITTNNHNFTLGGSGMYDGSVAFICCGHDMVNGGIVKSGSSTIGEIVLRQFHQLQYGDYSIIEAASGYTPTSAVLTTGGSVTHFNDYEDPAVGTYIYQYGYVTGQALCKVTQASRDVFYYGTVNIRGLAEAEIISGTVANGDSGGPIRNGRTFCGVLSGTNRNDDPTHIYYTPSSYFTNAGFEIAM